jgi:hypothetical protein
MELFTVKPGEGIERMDKLFARIQTKCLERKHLFPLLPSNPLTVLFESNREMWMLSLSKSHIDWSRGTVSCPHVRLNGKDEVFQTILLGKERLLTAVKRKDVSIYGPFRSQLQLEAIFWLCKEHEETAVFG